MSAAFARRSGHCFSAWGKNRSGFLESLIEMKCLYEVTVLVGQRREPLLTTPQPATALHVVQALQPCPGIEVVDDDGNALTVEELLQLSKAGHE
jgi:hypothetical protein